MKKKIIAIALICSFAVGCIGLSGCTTSDVSNSATSGNSKSSFVSEYASKYDFYADSVEKLKDDMELTNEEADKVFGVLLEVGLDEEITYCFDEKDESDNQYFKVWWGLNKVNVYLENNTVSMIFDGDKIIYKNLPDEKPNPNTNEMVDYLAAKARNDSQTATDEEIQEAIDWLKNNIDSYFSDNDSMEKAMYYGELLEYKYKDTNNKYEKAGWQAFKTIKYVYRGVEAVSDETTQNNLEELKELVQTL